MTATKSRKPSNTSEGEYVINNNGESTNQDWILSAYRSLEPRNYLHEFTSKNTRPDGRTFLTSRPLSIQTGVLNRNSAGSALISLGATRILAGCTLLVGRPSASTPNYGDIEISVVASPLSGGRFDLGGRENIESTSVMLGTASTNTAAVATENDVQLAHDPNDTNNNNVEHPPKPLDIKLLESYLRRVLRSSRYINPQELSIIPGKAAWRIRITVSIINSEGNVTDGGLLCLLAALSDLRIPMVDLEEVGSGLVVKIVTDEQQLQEKRGNKRQSGRKLSLGPAPIPTTIAILPSKNKNILVVDPTNFEEDMSYGNSVTVVCNTHGEIVDFCKRGSETRLSVDEMKAVLAVGTERAGELENLLVNATT